MAGLARALSLLLVATIARAGHECERLCVVGETRTCHYEFHVQEYHTLSRACFDCPRTLEDCSRAECVAGDGVPRPLLTVNRQMPGPSIQVCEGDQVVVDVFNNQLSDTEIIHWHGMKMMGQQYYDGAPFITQCPMMGGVFRYNFLANTPGTHFWHSHVGVHRGSAVFGSLVVRQADDEHLGIYHDDSFAHVIVLQDWVHLSASSMFSSHYHYTMKDFASTILVNGKGINSAAEIEGVERVVVPLEVIHVTSGTKHRLRIVGATGLNCPIVVSVDSHRLTIIALDGQETIPFTTDSFVIYSGERYDVVLEANQPVGNYWIKFNGLIDCQQNQCVQGAVLRYDGAPENDPTPSLVYDPSYPPGVVVNPVNTNGDEPHEVTMVDLDALAPSLLQPQVDRQFYLAFDFKQVNNSMLFNPDLYPFNGVSEEWQIYTPQVNGLSFKFPATPPLSQPEAAQPTICLYDETPPCMGDFCSCTYVLEVRLGQTVEMVLVDEGNIGDENHPFHLHGYSFDVVAMGRLGDHTSAEEVAALDAAGGIPRKLENPVKKDTVTIPDGGYTIIRFTANNPGWWLLHCHLVFHAELGMAALLHVGEPQDLPPLPKGFPTCGSYMPEL
ncbi:uncharacterized protein [Panulirus ornatus]|uniref:uncharacterized protein n=1 Tax=Panulirus ornatus TaxID=150431 RepID=UPI003A863AF7